VWEGAGAGGMMLRMVSGKCGVMGHVHGVTHPEHRWYGSCGLFL
jgi:hypothetical protein